MAIFHLSVKPIRRWSRKTGAERSATAAAAYRAGALIRDYRSGEVHDYRARRGVFGAEVHLPASAPAWMADRAALWNAVEASEKRVDARVAREMDVALPVELPRGKMMDLAREFVRECVTSVGMCADLAFHDLDSHNPHFHVLMTTRHVTDLGFGKKNRDWDCWGDARLVKEWRKRWADLANAALEGIRSLSRVDHRSLVEQGRDRLPTVHEGRWASINRSMQMPLPREDGSARALPWAMTPLPRRDWRSRTNAAVKTANAGATPPPELVARVALRAVERKARKWLEQWGGVAVAEASVAALSRPVQIDQVVAAAGARWAARVQEAEQGVDRLRRRADSLRRFAAASRRDVVDAAQEALRKAEEALRARKEAAAAWRDRYLRRGNALARARSRSRSELAGALAEFAAFESDIVKWRREIVAAGGLVRNDVLRDTSALRP